MNLHKRVTPGSGSFLPQGNNLKNIGGGLQDKAYISNILQAHPEPSSLRQEDFISFVSLRLSFFFKLYWVYVRIYGRGSHLGYVTHFRFPYQLRLHVKFGFF